MTVTVRPALPGDVSGIFTVRTSVAENLLTRAELAHLGLTEDAVADMIAAEPCAWVADQDGRILGFSMIDTAMGALFAAFVLPGHEGRGLGRALVAQAEAALFARHRTIWLETGAGTRAAGFYRRLGWSVARPAGPGDIRMEKHRP